MLLRNICLRFTEKNSGSPNRIYNDGKSYGTPVNITFMPELIPPIFGGRTDKASW
jgi:hypothetical protein